MHVLNDGDVFVSSEIPYYKNNIKFNPWTGDVQELGPLPDKPYCDFSFPSILLPLVAADGYQARILLCGGSRSQLFDFGNQTAKWQTVPRDITMENVFRVHACATLLPTGHVIMTGGAYAIPQANTTVFDQPAIFDQISTGNKPELYYTPLDVVTKKYKPGVGAWRTLDDPAKLLRNYHSTALLMPDGRIWVAGGNGRFQPNKEADPAVQKQIEIYQPPYPAGNRPVITDCPHFVAFGQSFTIGVSDASSIQNVVLMRCGSSTHAFNSDQRSLWLNFEKTGGGVSATAPPNGNVAPPGNYMVFVVDIDGRPCEYAKFIRLGGTVSMFTARNTIPKREIDAILSSSSPAATPGSFYILLDKFCVNDLNNGDRPFPPSVQFRFIKDNMLVPDLTAEFTATLLEAKDAPPYVTQQITLEFQLRFASANAFNGIVAGDQKEISIEANWGDSHTSARMYVLHILDRPMAEH